MPSRLRRLRPLALAALLVGAACARPADELPGDARIPLPEDARDARTLGADSAGGLWLGVPGWLVAVDSAGRATARVPTGATLRVLGSSGGRLLAREPGAGLALVDADSGLRRSRRESRERPAARDPRGRWIYAAVVNGGVVGLDPATLAPAWGWPETGAAATALAVSPLGDRVYLATASDDDGALVRVLDQQSGREVGRTEVDEPVTALLPGAGDDLFAVMEGGVRAFRHGAEGLEERWSVTAAALDLGEGATELRVSPDGSRAAAFRAGGRLALLAAEDGRILGRTTEAPADAAWGADGRLFVLEASGLRVLR